MEEVDYYISELIVLEVLGNINADERKRLNEWRSRSTENEALYQKIKEESSITQYIHDCSNFSSELGWEKFRKKTNAFRWKRFIQTPFKYAAVLVFPLLISTLFIASHFFFKPSSLEAFADSLKESNNTILVLANGELMNLDSIKEKRIQEENGLQIEVLDNQLDYYSARSSIKEGFSKKNELINMISIPRGGEYKLLLSDGTRVILNSMSSIAYPVRFSGGKRIIQLKGEAYFDVAKDSSPFIVEVNDMEIEVLGTIFNVKAYDESVCYTTIVEGCVKVKTSETEAILNPSEQAKIQFDSSTIVIKDVEPDIYTSWVDGKISFKDIRLEDILKSMSRWYNMTVVYEDESLKNIRFGCNVDKYSDLSSFLELLEETKSIRIEVLKNNIIMIKSALKTRKTN